MNSAAGLLANASHCGTPWHAGVPGLVRYGGDRDWFCGVQGITAGVAERAWAAVGKHVPDGGRAAGGACPQARGCLAANGQNVDPLSACSC